MKRTSWTLLAGMSLLLAGCGPGPDPLAWKVDGSDPAALQAWFDGKASLLPAPLGREFAVCVSNIQLTLPPARTSEPLEKAHHLCARLNGKTVREVLIEGNELSYKMMLARTKNQSDELLRLLSAVEPAAEDQREALPARIAAARARLDATRELVARGEKRLEELRAPPAQ